MIHTMITILFQNNEKVFVIFNSTNDEAFRENSTYVFIGGLTTPNPKPNNSMKLDFIKYDQILLARNKV